MTCRLLNARFDKRRSKGTPWILLVRGKAWGGPEVHQLLVSLHRPKVRSRGLWKNEVEGKLLPIAQALVSECLGGQDDGEQQVSEATALSLRPCANPLCTNVSGCSEGRLRGQRCSGCRAVRYCSTECQAADFGSHARVCGQLSSC